MLVNPLRLAGDHAEQATEILHEGAPALFERKRKLTTATTYGYHPARRQWAVSVFQGVLWNMSSVRRGRAGFIRGAAE